MPIAYGFNPDLVIVSAGFDAARGDPLGDIPIFIMFFLTRLVLEQAVVKCHLTTSGDTQGLIKPRRANPDRKGSTH